MTTSELLDRLSRDYDQFSKGQKRIADYILDNYSKVAYMTTGELAEAAGVSESTVVRFAYNLGCNGYPGLQKDLREGLQNKMTTVQRLNMMEGLSSDDLIRASFRTDIGNIEKTCQENPAQLLDRVVGELDDARSVYLLGTRSSWPLVQFVDYYLRYMMDNVHLIRFEGSDVYSQTLNAGAEDVLLAISFPRYSSTTIDVMEHMRSKSVRIITITDIPTSEPAVLSDYVLRAQSHMNSFVDSFVAPLALINVLIIKLGLRRKDVLFKNFAQLEDMWKEGRTYAAGRTLRNKANE